MDEATLQLLAQAIARQEILQQWPTYLLTFLLAIVGGFGASFISSYGKKRGELLATKADFDLLLDQLRATTVVAEEVKARVSHADWVAREYKALRRQKLEELMHLLHQVQAWTEAARDKRLFDSPREPGDNPWPKLQVLVGLYFPELKRTVERFGDFYRKMILKMLEAHGAMLTAQGDLAARQRIFDQFKVEWQPLYASQLQVISEIEAEARAIMEAITSSTN